MADHVDVAKRSEIMRAVHSTNTKPEMAVRKIVHRMGYRYRLHVAALPGKPDLVFPRLHKVVFVHGCFWHRHPGCRYATTPKTRTAFWQAKFDMNVLRDRRNMRALNRLGWSAMKVWQCQLKDPNGLAERLDDFLSQ